MDYYNIRSASDALVYFLDCQLATVQHMAMKKSRPAGEYKRQISIAQKMLEQCRWHCEDPYKILNTRAGDFYSEFESIEGVVEKWAKEQEPK